jgi:ABC-type sugar transport system ATPase subunit
MNLLEGTIVGEQSQRVFLADGWLIDPVSLAPQVTGTLHCGFRPESLFPGHGKLSGCVQAVETSGDAVYVQVELPAPRGRPQSAIARQQTPGDPPQVGSTIPLTLDTTRLHWFDRHSGHRL